jgi:putative tricarboxylic transport membrane protein
MGKFLKPDQVVGLIFMVLGILSLIEGYRLLPFRTQGVAGDDTFPFVLGFIMLILGACVAFVLKPRNLSASWPKGKAAKASLESAGVMIAYAVLIPYLGYAPSTFLASAGLLRFIGGYRWLPCLLSGAGLAGAFHVIFGIWLQMPFPLGIFGI